MKLETFEVDVTSKEAKVLLKQLEALGIIRVRPKSAQPCGGDHDIQTRAARLTPIAEEEIVAEVKAARKQRSHAASRKPQARR